MKPWGIWRKRFSTRLVTCSELFWKRPPRRKPRGLLLIAQYVAVN
jgi:hypothetical protein